MIVLDSNIWIAAFHSTDSLHKKALDLFSQIEKEHILLPEYVLIETANVLMIRAKKSVAQYFIQSTANNTDIHLLVSSKELLYETSDLFTKTKPRNNFSFVDTALLYLSKSYTVLTFDKKLEKSIKQR